MITLEFKGNTFSNHKQTIFGTFGSRTNLLQKQHTLKQIPKLHSMTFCRNKSHYGSWQELIP